MSGMPLENPPHEVFSPFYAAISKFTLMSPAASSNNGSMSSPLSFFSPENKNFVKIKAFFNVLAQL